MDASLLNDLKLGLEGEHQYLNAGLAIALCSTWLQRTGHLEINYLEQTVSSITWKIFCRELCFVLLNGICCFCVEIELSARAVY